MAGATWSGLRNRCDVTETFRAPLRGVSRFGHLTTGNLARAETNVSYQFLAAPLREGLRIELHSAVFEFREMNYTTSQRDTNEISTSQMVLAHRAGSIVCYWMPHT